MGPTLQVADQRGAFILVEEGSFLATSDVLSLARVEIASDDALLVNPYTAIVPDGDDAASQFVAWLVSPVGRAELQSINQTMFGRQVYVAGP